MKGGKVRRKKVEHETSGRGMVEGIVRDIKKRRKETQRKGKKKNTEEMKEKKTQRRGKKEA